jgi:hypothetical protein
MLRMGRLHPLWSLVVPARTAHRSPRSLSLALFRLLVAGSALLATPLALLVLLPRLVALGTSSLTLTALTLTTLLVLAFLALTPLLLTAALPLACLLIAAFLALALLVTATLALALLAAALAVSPISILTLLAGRWCVATIFHVRHAPAFGDLLLPEFLRRRT